MSGFKKASRAEQYLRMAIQGASGAGKTRSALEIAKHLAQGGKIALIDTEKSASLYSDVVDFDVDDDFGPIGKENYAPEKWREKAIEAAKAGYKVLVLDSATHLWKGPGGFLSEIDTICANQRARGGKGDSFAAWKTVDPRYMAFMQFIRALPMHVIFCIRAKVEYERTTDGKGGLKKVGMAPEYRDGYEYEFDIQAAIDMDHVLVPLKHRLDTFLDGRVFAKPGQDFAEVCLSWLASGAAAKVNADVAAEIAKKVEPVQRTDLPRNTVPVEKPSLARAADKLTDGQAAADAGVAACETPAALSVADELRARMLAAVSEAELALVAKDASAAKKDGKINGDEYKALTKAYSATLGRLKAARPPPADLSPPDARAAAEGEAAAS